MVVAEVRLVEIRRQEMAVRAQPSVFTDSERVGVLIRCTQTLGAHMCEVRAGWTQGTRSSNPERP